VLNTAFTRQSYGDDVPNASVPTSTRLIWALTYLIGGTAAVIIPDVQNRWQIAGLLFALVPVQLLWHRIFFTGLVLVTRMTIDALMGILISLWSPSLWFPMLLILLTSMMNVRPEQIGPVGRFLMFAALLTQLAIGGITNQSTWLATSVVVMLLVMLRVSVVRSMWREVESAAAELDVLLESVSAVLHSSNPYTGRVKWVSHNIERITGWTAEEWTGTDPIALIHPDDLEHFWLPLSAIRLGQQHERYARHRRKDGSWVWLSVNATVATTGDGRLEMRGHYTDASELVAAQQEITALANRDTVTGLSNRHVLLRRLTSFLEAGTACGLLMMDVDRFKAINDTLGHNFGDDVLRELAFRIDHVAGAMLVCRLGGDEFAVLVDHPADTERLAVEIGRVCARPMHFGDITVSSQVSIGSVVSPDNGVRTEDLLRRADMAMYEAKRRRQLHVTFESAMEQSSAQELQLSAGLSQALDSHEFEVFFQPKIDLATGKTIGAEGLVRWRHPERGILRPASFMHLVRLSNEHRRFTDTVIDQAVAFAARTRDVGMTATTLPVAVNIMVASLFDEGLPSRIGATLKNYGVAPELLTLEVTEDDIMEEFASVSPVISKLAAMGLRLSIDDFGTGYSSMSRLVDLPVAEIKIDRRFVTGMASEVRERAVIESIILLAGRLGVDVVAEGIEERREAEFLKEFGCRIGQGFLYSRAVDAEDFLVHLGLAAPQVAERSEQAEEVSLSLGDSADLIELEALRTAGT